MSSQEICDLLIIPCGIITPFLCDCYVSDYAAEDLQEIVYPYGMAQWCIWNTS
jgi:hypothetical protein